MNVYGIVCMFKYKVILSVSLFLFAMEEPSVIVLRYVRGSGSYSAL